MPRRRRWRPWFAREALTPDRGSVLLPIDVPYAVGETVRWFDGSDCEVLALVPALAAAIVTGDDPTSAGDGTLKKANGTTDVVVARAAENVNNAAGPRQPVFVSMRSRRFKGRGPRVKSSESVPHPAHLSLPQEWRPCPESTTPAETHAPSWRYQSLQEYSMPATLMLGDDPVDMQYLGSFYKSMPARLLEANLNLDVLRTNTLLHKDEWELLDRRVIEISADVMNAIADLRALGLTTQLGGLGVLMSQYEQVSDMTEANVNMAVEVDDEEDRLNFPLVGIPVPIISKGFRIDARSLAATRRAGGASIRRMWIQRHGKWPRSLSRFSLPARRWRSAVPPFLGCSIIRLAISSRAARVGRPPPIFTRTLCQWLARLWATTSTVPTAST